MNLQTATGLPGGLGNAMVLRTVSRGGILAPWIARTSLREYEGWDKGSRRSTRQVKRLKENLSVGSVREALLHRQKRSL